MSWISAANQTTPLNWICWISTLFVVRYTFHAFEKAKCYKMSLENQQFLKILLSMISPNFVRKSTQKKKIQQIEENFKDLEIFQNLKFTAEENEGRRPSLFCNSKSAFFKFSKFLIFLHFVVFPSLCWFSHEIWWNHE